MQWADVDFAQRSIYVKHASKKSLDGKFALGTTKTEKSRRRIVLPQIALEALAAHRKLIMAEGHGSTFVFCNQRAGTPPVRSSMLERVHYATLERTGLPRITFHDLRHTAATTLMELGIHPKIAQERLRHSTIRTTLDIYSHPIPSMQEGAAEALYRRFGGKNA